ncbi:MAG: hypothetical protein NT120_00585 [Candidatus Aenigmarchaeota archaeon]|nr:hypothetical protein [Candidatus Aenigmarchaeota archaeon]
MFTTLNPKVTKGLMLISLVISFFAIYQNGLAALTFLTGIVVSFPIIYDIWIVMEKNWDSLYKKFYLKAFHRRNKQLIKKSVKLTWWVIPWSIIIYSTISFAIMRFDQSFNLLLSYIFGSIFIIALVTNVKSRKYYEEIK